MADVARRMRAAPSGTYIPQEDGPAISFKRVERFGGAAPDSGRGAAKASHQAQRAKTSPQS